MLNVHERHFSDNIKRQLESILTKFGLTFEKIYNFTVDNGANVVCAARLIETEVLSQSEELSEDVLDDESFNSNLAACSRCAAHTLQLSVTDVLKPMDRNSNLITIRNLCKLAKTVRFRFIFEERGIPLPQGDVITRWGSTYNMISSFVNHRGFYEDLAATNTDFRIDSTLWNFMVDFEAAFKPLYDITLKLQSEDLLMGNKKFKKNFLFYKIFI